ncbi:hypothetical protein [Sandaracinus amylolyticus]|uniref:hypothetical protein n=1 Tax=Sandaracinus amylolyticus TaxID=927083 RepID=UPI00069EEA5F|nr:hypothetical protein [Sandaracinus amylolyticus]
MLLRDDDDILPDAASDLERAFVDSLDADERRAVESRILSAAQRHWLKAARVVWDAIDASDYDVWDASVVHAHVRALAGLVGAGELESRGDLRRPRFSEVCLPPHA